MYNNIVLNLFNNPKNAGRISKPDGIADVLNQDGTAHVEFSLRIENGVITESKFRAQANPYIIAVCSTITQMLKGKMVSMAFIDPYAVKNELGDENQIDIDFCVECVKLAILDYKEKFEKAHKHKKGEEKDDFDQASDLVEEKHSDSLIKQNVQTTEQDEEDDDFADFFDDLFDEEV